MICDEDILKAIELSIMDILKWRRTITFPVTDLGLSVVDLFERRQFDTGRYLGVDGESLYIRWPDDAWRKYKEWMITLGLDHHLDESRVR